MPLTELCRRREEQKRLYDKIRCQTAEYRAKERARYHASTIPNGRQSHLYIVKYENDCSGCFKVGRTGDFGNRLKDLNKGHLKRVEYVAQYLYLGHLEILVHDELFPYRVQGASREWFEVDVERIDDTIRSLAGNVDATYFIMGVNLPLRGGQSSPSRGGG